MPSLLETKGVPLDRQKFARREMVQQPIEPGCDPMASLVQAS